jgi:hypothetical protein
MKLRISLAQLTIAVLFFSFLFGISCSRENSSTTPEDEIKASRISSESNADGEIVFNDVFDNVMGPNDNVGMTGTGIFGQRVNTDPGISARPDTLPPCVSVTVTYLNPPAPFPIRIVIDFGSSNTGCICRDGRVRRGKIITEYTNRLIIPGAIATTTFENYYVDSLKVEGTHIIKNTSSPVSITPPPDRIFTVDVVNGKLTRPNGNYFSWSSHKVITQTEGLATPNIPIDDVFKIEGTAQGQVFRDNMLVAWQSTTIEPLIKRFNCRWIVKGKIRTRRVASSTNNTWEAILDFGNGTCDNLATITINGVTYNITLR